MPGPETDIAEITWEDLIRILEERPEWLARVRQVVLTPDLLSLPEAVRELVEAQQQTTFQIQELVEVQRRHEERLASVEERLSRLEATVQELVEAQWRHEERLAGVEERLSRLEATVQELVEVQRRHEERLAGVEERLSRLEATVQELVEAQRQTTFQIQAIWEAIQRNTAQLKDLTEVAQTLVEGQRRLDGTVGEIKGNLLEIKYREQPYAYFGHLLRAIQAIPLRTIEQELESHLRGEELRDAFRLDLLLRGRLRDHPERPEVWLAVEVSSVVDKGDVERAGRRAALLRKAGFRAIPVAAGLGVNEEAQREAQWDKVVVVKDGQVFFWDEALQHYLGEANH